MTVSPKTVLLLHPRSLRFVLFTTAALATKNAGLLFNLIALLFLCRQVAPYHRYAWNERHYLIGSVGSIFKRLVETHGEVLETAWMEELV